MPSDGLPKNLEPLAAGDPATIGPYVLSGKLGSGGMGTVYLGSLPDRGNQVAIKVIRPELAFDEATRARFRDEMENARKVASFCTAKVLDHGTFENRPYMVTEYIAGTALAEHIAENGPLDSSTLHGFALGVAAALAAIHRTGLVHRDLKPANVLLSLSGPRVIDFGIARAMNTATNHTQTGIVMGSPGWMAPEQLLEEQVTTKADIFAWGCLVAFAGNGTHPFGNGDAMTLGKRVLFAEPQIGNLDSPLDRLVLRALDKDPNRRPTAQDLLLELAGGEESTNPNEMVSHALHQSWRPNLPPTAPPHPQQGHHPGMAGMHPGHYQAPSSPVPQGGPGPQTAHPGAPAHQTGNFVHPQQAPPPAHPGGHPQQGAQQRHAGHPPAQHPASTGPIPMVPPADQQAPRPGPQPYVPPVPPPPHRPAAPGRRRSLLVIAAAAGVALLVALLTAVFVVVNSNGSAAPGGAQQSGTGAPAPGEDGGQDGSEVPEKDPAPTPGEAPVSSADGMVTYGIARADCGMERVESRSTLRSGQYCVISLRLENHSDEVLAFDHDAQGMLTREGSTLEAETPSRTEYEEPLWSGGIAPGEAAAGELVFILSADDGPETLVLSHRPGGPETRIAVSGLVD
ncbi:serine/threonine-protein kinase [Nocardiopsis algeriensis]|uniref:Serine/threonine protein kinase n=1 Tax=Nocardiopsis algeriensis TaxID=1478215 RepID=A0A841ILP6_9ACTN|nr:serine/threonine-protein kinase [Nocardiopsis algeriensis]MBB6118972.1 serine/threonine protein kinase [Nocardiopsis algeriensis]